jgi:hypothetical protein
MYINAYLLNIKIREYKKTGIPVTRKHRNNMYGFYGNTFKYLAGLLVLILRLQWTFICCNKLRSKMGRISCNELLVTIHDTTRCHDPLTIKTSQSKSDKSKLKLHSQTYEQFKLGKRAPSICSESFFFQAAIQKGKVNCYQTVQHDSNSPIFWRNLVP